MRIISRTPLVAFYQKYPDAKVPLEDWYKRVKRAQWQNLDDIRKTFNSVDYVGNSRYVFNIKGNTYRLVVAIVMAAQSVYIRFVGTHAEYDKINCRTI